MDAPKLPNSNIWLDELNDLLRGASGGFLFGIPLLYTVEVWGIGSSTPPSWLLSALAITFVVVYLLNQTEGFRKNTRIQPIDAAMETIESMAIGIVCAFVALVLLRRITLDTPLTEMLGKLIFEGIPFSFGVALARSTLSRGPSSKRRVQRDASRRVTPLSQLRLNATIADLDATLIGSLIIGFNIAPTEEISILATSIPPPWLLLIVAASLLISYTIVFASGFTNQTERRQQQGLFQRPLSETLISYLVSLLASALMLWFFQQLSWENPWQEWLSDILVLGLPAAIGGAAGRIVI
jgi:putative integral membrane protein (TIGR02587 family)